MAFLSTSALALNPDLTIKQLHHTAWRPSQGAPLGGAVGLAQTSDGYLWMASPSGLFRFDGITFERVELPHDGKLSSLALYSIFAPQRGGLWIGFTFGGVAFLKDGHWQVYTADDGLPAGSPREFTETRDGLLWVSTSADLARFDGSRWRAVGSNMGLMSVGPYPSLFADSQGTLWVAGRDALFFLREGEQQFRNQPVAVRGRWTGSAMAESRDGTVWLSIPKEFDSTDVELVQVAQNPPPVAPVSSSGSGLVFDYDDTLWTETSDGLRRMAHLPRASLGTVVHSDALVDTYTNADGLSARGPVALLVDREGNIWVITREGLDRFSEPRLEAPLQSADNLKAMPGINVVGLAPSDDTGGLWVTNGDNLLLRFKDGRLSGPVLTQDINCLLRGPDGTVWMGGSGGFWHEHQGRLESLPPLKSLTYTQALALDKSGNLWASVVRSGVFRLKDGMWTPYGGIVALPRGPAITIVRDHHDRLWFSYPGGHVAVLDGEQVRIYAKADGLQIGNLTANYPGRIDEWLGGELGLARFDGERFHTIRSVPELPLDGITGIVETAGGDLWLNGRMGIVHLTAPELDRSRRDPSYPVQGEAFGAPDGVVGSAALLRPLPSAIEAGDGKLWFSTNAGFYGIDPARPVHNRTPALVHIRALTVGDRQLAPESGISLPERTTAVRFDYVGLGLTAAEKVRYRYRLDGVDSDWRPITGARQALYSNLRPGHYRFHVIAANNDGVWNEQGASLGFTIPPAFVQTGWFLALCVAGGLLAVWALVRLRVRQVAAQVRRRLEERMAERERMARDLHDTLLQGIQGLVLRFHVGVERIPKGEPAREMLNGALERADQVLDEGRRRIKALRAHVGGVPRLPEAVARIVEQLAPAGTSPFHVTIEGAVRELDPIVSEEVQLLASEALTNAYYHANASKIEAEITYADDALTVRVRDDGKGIDRELLREGRPAHFGLLGMRERAKKICAHLDIWSKPGAGTEVEIRVPAAIAYRELASRSRRRLWWRKAALPDTEDADHYLN